MAPVLVLVLNSNFLAQYTFTFWSLNWTDATKTAIYADLEVTNTGSKTTYCGGQTSGAVFVCYSGLQTCDLSGWAIGRAQYVWRLTSNFYPFAYVEFDLASNSGCLGYVTVYPWNILDASVPTTTTITSPTNGATITRPANGIIQFTGTVKRNDTGALVPVGATINVFLDGVQLLGPGVPPSGSFTIINSGGNGFNFGLLLSLGPHTIRVDFPQQIA